MESEVASTWGSDFKCGFGIELLASASRRTGVWRRFQVLPSGGARAIQPANALPG